MEEKDVELKTQAETEEILEETKSEELVDDKITGEVIDKNPKKKKLTKEEKKEKRAQKKIAKIKKKMFFENDIKYKGVFSYRHLRIIAWISLAATQLLSINNLTSNILTSPLLDNGMTIFMMILSALAVPLFLLATFSTILNKNKTYKAVILFYLAAYLAIAIGIIFVYERYLKGILNLANDGEMSASKAAGELLGYKFQVNVFADLLALSLFHFFLNYKPNKYFQGKNLKFFRLLCLVPLAVELVSYIIKINESLGNIVIPFELYPFLTTKPPLVYLLFILLTFWMKKREKTYMGFGSTEEQYEKFLNSNMNSLSFSKNTSLILALISILDVICLFVLIIIYGEYFLDYALALEVGQCMGLFVAIPVIMLFSYTKKYKTTNLDIIIPIAGLGLIAFTYVEAIYEIALKLLAQ